MRANGALETVQQKHARGLGSAIYAVNFEKVAVGSIPTLDTSRCGRLSPEELSPQCLQVATANPPRGRIDYVSAHSTTARVSPVFLQSRSQLEVQIFGIKKSADTRKALRFFSERRIKTHFVDLMERPASLGELRRFAQKFGVGALVDRDAKRFNELGLRYAQLSDERWLEKLSEEPLLLRLPLVRNGNQVLIGADEKIMKTWMESR